MTEFRELIGLHCNSLQTDDVIKVKLVSGVSPTLSYVVNGSCLIFAVTGNVLEKRCKMFMNVLILLLPTFL